MLLVLEQIAGEHSVNDLARRSERGGGFKGLRVCRRPLRELVLVDFVLYVSIASLVSIVGG